MKVFELQQLMKDALTSRYGQSEANAIIDLYLQKITGLEKTARNILDQELVLENAQASEDLDRLSAGEPVQYVINEAWFYHMNLYVDSSVLIPRPETEELVHWIINDAKEIYPELLVKHSTDADATRTLKVLDVGTGSGCIALALKKNIPLAEVWGCDISADALNVARRNASTLDIRVDFQQVNFLNAMERKQLPTVDILVSNPPYIPDADRSGMTENVLNHEPHLALFPTGNDPLIFYRMLVEHSLSRLSFKGILYAEMHYATALDVEKLFRQNGFATQVKKDLTGNNRMLKAWRTS